MKARSLAIALALLLGGSVLAPLRAEDAAAEKKDEKSKLDTLVEKMTKSEGLLTLYHDDQKLYGLLKSGDYNKDFIVLTSIARGISKGMVLGGMSWNFGDDAIWSFKKVGEKVHVLRKNVRFRADEGTPEGEAVKFAYNDSVLYALPILTSASGADLVDFSRVFMSDDQQIGRAIGAGFHFVADRSTWSKVKVFEKNVQLQVAAVYSGQGALETVSDSRGVQVGVHYSISELPKNGYKPRIADDRVGYFLTVVKDFSKNPDEEHFVRYINRWKLEKQKADATLSNPKEPIKFWIEKTVPYEWRPYVISGITEWNKAFEKIGYSNAIIVEEQSEGDQWDPEDVSYNTFRWITAEAGFAMGPSRVNPLTGEILDADIIFDASFLQHWKTSHETFTSEDARILMGGGPGSAAFDRATPEPFADIVKKHSHAHTAGESCMLCQGMQQQMGFAAAVLTARGLVSSDNKLPEEFIQQGLKEVVMHEVGHTLGLRHNFKASAWKSLDDIDKAKAGGDATVASVMDYAPANIAADKDAQGLYYTQTIGPYDYWAIEYGYKQVEGDEKAELAKIAARGAEEGLDFATDEDSGPFDPDPLANRFDLGKEPLKFAQRQMKLANELLPKIVERTVDDGEAFNRARQAFGMLFREYWRTAAFAARFPGGVHVNRDHKADPNARPPLKVASADEQRGAMKLLAETAFAPQSYDPELLNHLAATRWEHWGIRESSRTDFPIHSFVESAQEEICFQLLNPMTLDRMHDNEVKVAADGDAYTTAEHFNLFTGSVFSEWKDGKSGEYTNRTPYISSFRRNLQRIAVRRLTMLITNPYSGPEDSRVLARMHLQQLADSADARLKQEDLKLDDYTRAHLQDSKKRIEQCLNAELELNSVN